MSDHTLTNPRQVRCRNCDKTLPKGQGHKRVPSLGPITLPPLFLLDSGWWVFAAETADNKAPASLGMLVASPDPQDPNIERYITMSIHFVRTDAQDNNPEGQP